MMTLASAGGAAVSTVTRPRRSASGVAILDLSEKREGGGAGDRYVGRKAFLLFTRGFAREIKNWSNLTAKTTTILTTNHHDRNSIGEAPPL